MTDPSPATIALWTSLVSASRHLVETIEARLKHAGLPPLTWYDALLEIEKAGPDGLRPFELQGRLLLPQYGTSRLLDRIAAAGYVDRVPSPEDGRGQIIRITPAGHDIRRKIWPVYARSLAELIEARLPPDAVAPLTAALRHLRGTAPSEPQGNDPPG
jgi:DNA-binding MarR family transcriptional regulator